MTKAKASDKADNSAGGSAKSSRRATPGWLSLAVAALAVVLIATLGVYGLRIFRSAAFSDERAFRVLNEIGDQLGNFQNTIASLMPDFVPESSSGNVQPLRVLALQDVSISPSTCSQEELGNQAPIAFRIDIHYAARPFSVRKCVENLEKTAIEVRGTLHQHLPQFVEQRYFDTLVIAPANGVAIASLSRETGAGPQVRLHPAEAAGFSVVDASGLLRHAAQQEEKDDKVAMDTDDGANAPSAGPAPSHPLVLNEKIGGRNYRVFVLPFEPTYPIELVSEPSAPISATPSRHLYLIGLKEVDTFESFAAALGSRGANVMTLIALLAIMAWPLLSLRFLTTHEPISRTQFALILSALAAVPAILTCAGFAVWSTQRLQIWADKGAEVYARAIERSLLEELSLGTKVLDTFAKEIVAATPKECVGTELFVSCPKTFNKQTDREQTERGQHPRIRVVAALNLEGQSSGLVRYTLGPSGASERLKLADREYFRAIREEQEWPKGEWAPWNVGGLQFYQPLHGLVAQRLFNRSDAARALQIAVPIQRANGERIGVATGDTRAYALANAAAVPLLRFAVIDNATGVVIFHSDDGRSLAENFFVETEQNPRLRALMSKRSSRWSFSKVASEDHFEGRYVGEPHRFFFRPVAGAPWSVVVMYSTDTIAAVIRQATLATITTYFALLIAVLIILGFIFLLARGRPDRDMLALLWPKWRSRDRYAVFAAAAWIVLAAVILYLLLDQRSSTIRWAAVCGLVALLAAAFSIRLQLWRKPWDRAAMTLQTYQNAFVVCVVCALIVVAVVPTAWLTTRYHDTALKGLIGEELRAAAAKISEGHSVVVNDLRRWTAYVPERRDELDSWAIVKERFSPGFVAEDIRTTRAGSPKCTAWVSNVFPSGPWLTNDRLQWDPGQRFLDAMWSGSNGARASRGWRTWEIPLKSGEEEPDPVKNASGPAGSDPCAGQMYLVSSRSRTHDGRRFIVAMTGNPRGDAADYQPIYDDDLNLHDRKPGIVLGAVAIALVLALALLSWHVSRRLFGIRIPFAGRYLAPSSQSVDQRALLEAELDLLAQAERRGKDFTLKDQMDWRVARCKAHYQAMWDALDKEEQLLLHQLAKGSFANPENQSVIERLIARGYLTLRPWIRIADCGFETFARTAEPEGTFAAWQREASRSTWTLIRTPLLVIVVAVAVLLTWVAGSAMQIFSATLVGAAALFTSITQLTGFLRKESRPLPSASD